MAKRHFTEKQNCESVTPAGIKKNMTMITSLDHEPPIT